MGSSIRNGGQILMRQLYIQGARRVFLVPGESFLPCIDALNEYRDAIQPIVCRHEGGATFMAEALGKLTGEPGICFVTRGPGATNASIGVHTAYQDSTPMILFIGQVGGDFAEREAFQEIDYRRMFGEMTKWVAQIDRAERIPEFVARAYATATAGRPGPVVLALPEDVLWEQVSAEDLPRYPHTDSHPSASDIAQVRDLLERAERPLLLVGGSRWRAESISRMAAFAARFQLPVASAWRRLECFDQRNDNAVGQVGWGMDAALRRHVLESDLILAVGTRMGEATTEGYSLIQSPQPTQKLIHVYPDANELGRVFQPNLAIVAGVNAFAAAVENVQPAGNIDRHTYVAAMRQAYLTSLNPLPAPGAMSLDDASAVLNRIVPADACVTVGAGNYALYPHRYRQFGGAGSSLASTLGAMGYGLPAAISAKLENPDQTVVCYAGDGCFQMNMQELGVAMQHRLGVVVLVFCNGMYGTIRAHQERDFPARPIALDLPNPDFALLVRAYGGYGETVENNDDFEPALKRALEFAEREQLPALLQINYDPDGIAPGETLSAIRTRALMTQRHGA